MKIVTDESGLSVDICIEIKEEYKNKNYISISGGDNRNLFWNDYLDDFREEYKKYILLIKKVIEENDLVGITGKEQNGWIFKFSDDVIWGFTWRGWGDLMQSIVNKKEGYMAYYM